MATCSGTATIKRDSNGDIISATLDCPKDSCPETQDPAKRTTCRGITRKVFGSESKQKEHLETDVQYCLCLTADQADPSKHVPWPTEPPPGCILQMKLVYKVVDGKRGKPISADVYCSGSCGAAGEECPTKPTPAPTKDNDGNITEVYKCNCVAKPK